MQRDGEWNISNSVKSAVRALKAYSLSGERGTIKINQNENPWDVAPEVKKAALDRLRDKPWSRYPGFIPEELQQRLAEFSNWNSDGVVVGNGSNELIQSLLMITAGPGRKVLISEPTFALYRQISTIMGSEVISVPLTPDFQYDVEGLIDATRQHSPVVTIICSPNNPTGTLIPDSDLERLLDFQDGIIALDEAYFEFSGRSASGLLERHPNLVLFRTFSKAMAMAGLRVGYLLAHPDLATEIRKAVLPYNLNIISQFAAVSALDSFESSFRPRIEAIVSERDRLYSELLTTRQFKPVKSHGNFMIVQSKIGPKTIFQKLLARGILIRDVSSYPMLSEYFRIRVGTPEENEELLDALRRIDSDPAATAEV
jgi:histidinol-phosphate aminotransferase